MAFTPKDWKDSPDASTPITAVALEDLETRLSDYSDLVAIGLALIRVARGKGVVVHGSTANTARPTEYKSIEWIGSVQPSNAVDYDTWIDTA